MSVDNASPASAALTAGPQIQSTINVTENQGTVIGTQIINRAPAAPALHQLRAPIGDFVGRAAEIDQLVQALSTAANTGAAAISCVRGMAGVGKTELAYRAAQQLGATFPDAQLLVDLRGVSPTPLSPAQALQSIIRAFEREAKLPDDLDELAGLYAAALAGKRALILADDAQDAAQVRALLPPPGCALLITSRNRFALPAMRAIDLDTLPPAEAAQLLLAICPRIGADADALAKECGYLPLALRISAGLLATNDTRPVSSCLARVGTARLSYLSDPDDPTASVERSLQLSYADLTPDGQAALSQLSVFPASFDAPAAVAVVAVAGDGSEALELLRRTNLLEWDAAQQRYNLQDLVRVFGAARLDAADPVQLRHAQHYLQVASSAVQDLYLKGQALAGLALFDRERTQIDAGWSWSREHAGDPNADQLLIDYTNATLDVSLLRYDARTERIPQLEACQAVAQRQGRKDQEYAALGNLANAYADLGDMHKAIDYYEQALVIAREIGERGRESNILFNLGSAYKVFGNPSKAIECYQQALAIVREIGDRGGEATALGNLGLVYANLGDAAKAIEYLEQQLAITREISDKGGEAIALGKLGQSYGTLGDAAKAIEYLEQQLAIVRELGDRRGEASALESLGLATANLGDLPKASTYQEQALAIVRELGDRRGEAYALDSLGDTYIDLGDLPKAIDCCEQQLAIVRELGDRRNESSALESLGQARAKSGDTPKAIECYEQALTIAREIGDQGRQCYVLGDLGYAYANLGDLPKAITYQQQRLAIAQQVNNLSGAAFARYDLSALFEAQGDLAKAAELMQGYVDFKRSTNNPDVAVGAKLEQMRQQLAGKSGGKPAEAHAAGPAKAQRRRPKDKG